MAETIENADVEQVGAENALVIAVSHDAVFGDDDGALSRAGDGAVSGAGLAFPLLQAVQSVNERLSQLNPPDDSESVRLKVVLVCAHRVQQQQQQKDQVQSRARSHGLQIDRFSFPRKDDFADSLVANKVHLFVTTNASEATRAADRGVLSALLDPVSACGPPEQLRVMFCGDSIIDPKSHQAAQVFWSRLGQIRQRFGVADSPLSLVLLSSHGGISGCRGALQSLRTVGLNADEAYCLGGSPRKPLMSLLRPHFLLGAPEE
ncbi:cytosolic 5'-nucleotidase 1A-like [Eucyclogobius newberryi]|uniref:cytosolic 5'-nucleotidase 1A-like n=1 Tax=Eucyclogobius newberryi TaxID=166745 RepID=UPI003B5950FC